MTLQLSTAARNAALDAIEAAVGASPTLTINTGPPPSSADAAATGTVLATLLLPADWMAAANGGSKELLGTWQDASADATGTAAHFRISGAANIQGTVTATGGGGDMQLDKTNIVAGEGVSITGFTITAGGA